MHQKSMQMELPLEDGVKPREQSGVVKPDVRLTKTNAQGTATC